MGCCQAKQKPPVEDTQRDTDKQKLPASGKEIADVKANKSVNESYKTALENSQGSSAQGKTAIGQTLSSGKSIYEEELPDDAVARAMVEYANDTAKKGIPGLIEEFKHIQIPEPSPPHEAFSANAEKNRYPHIPCFDHSRVILTYKVPPETDYVHANTVDSKIVLLKNRFICAQGPSVDSAEDFWRMVWQEKPKYIFMLCGVVENGKMKCYSYYPDTEGEMRQYGDLKIIHYGEDEKGSETAFDIKLFKIRHVDLSVKESIVVKHCSFKDWPELGVPKSGMGLWRVLRKIDMEKGTAILHCSSGIGRTGVVMTAEIFIKALYTGKYVKMPLIVDEVREQRHGMIVSPGQYVYMHFAICSFVAMKLANNPKAAGAVARLKDFFKEYQEWAAKQEIEDQRRKENKKRLSNDTPKHAKQASQANPPTAIAKPSAVTKLNQPSAGINPTQKPSGIQSIPTQKPSGIQSI